MKPSTRFGLVLLLGCSAIVRAGEDDDWRPPPPPPPPPGAVEEARQWAADHAVPLATYEPGNGFDDLEPIGRLIGERRVVALGEGMHDTHEFLSLRNRLFQYLVETKGFTAYAAETGVTEAMQANRYVLGGDVPPKVAAAAVFSWAEEAFGENLALLDWMKARNARHPDRPLHFYGLDLTGGRMGKFVHARRAVDEALAYLRRVDAAEAGRLDAVLGPLLESFSTEKYASLGEGDRGKLSGALTDLVGVLEREHIAYVAASSRADYHEAHRNAVVAHQLDMNFRSRNGDEQSQRDASMARNLMRVLDLEGPRGKVMVFAYNGHVRKGRGDGDYASLGQYAHELLGDELYAIGTYFNVGEVGFQGGPTWPMDASASDSLNAAWLEGAKKPLFLLDMAKLPKAGPFAQWLAEGKPGRNHYWEGSPSTSYDAVIYVERLSGVRAVRD